MNNGMREIRVIKPTIFTDKKVRMAVYCRVSTAKDDQINSFMAQMKYYTDYIRSHDEMEFVDIYADEGITGTCVNKRDDFLRMIKDCENRKIDRIIVKSVARFARNSLECIEYVRKLAEFGVSVYFENDNIDTKNMNSEMILYIKSAFAQGESMSASKRMSTSIRMKMEDGTFVTTSAPYGYRLDNKQLIVVSEEAEIVKRIFDMYLSGLGMNVITTMLNREKVGGIQWSLTHIKYIISNEKYIGDMLMQKTYTPQVFPLKNRRNHGEKDQYYSEGTHEAIIAKEVFETAQEIRKERELRYRKSPTADKPFLTKRLRCRECNWIYKRLIRNGENVWVCSRKGDSGHICNGISYKDDDVYSAFIRMYNILRQNEKVILDDTITQLQNLRNRITKGNSKIAEIDMELASLTEKNNMYVKLHNKNVIDEVSYLEKTDSIKKKISELRIRRIKLLNEDEDERCIEALRTLKGVLNEAPKSMSEMDKELFCSIVKCVYAEQDGALTFELLGELQLRVEVKHK